ncbi:MAG: hypothetical protein M0R74_15465 [Dehalococcoidia bacterium]|nr:hypothetical protein [Dehalococcoidia bacterium]
MAKRSRKKKAETGEQMDLIDTAPENEKQIVAAAKKYKKISADRQALTAQEVEAKKTLLDLVKAADLQLVDGKIQFHVNGMTITVTPRDELIRVKEDGEE